MLKSKKIKRLILSILSCVAALALLILGLYVGMNVKGANLLEKYTVQSEAVASAKGFGTLPDTQRLHFLNTGGSDCILIESNGLFALVDCAEDTDNPRGFSGLELQGYEDKVIEYVKKVAGDKNGKVTLEWVLGTHSHSDHVGGFDTLILDPDITVKKAFLKTYDETYINDYEIKNWDNKEVYTQMADACRERGVELVANIPSEPWQFGGMTVQFFNTGYNTAEKTGENENAVGTKLTINGKTAFFAADINNKTKVEEQIAPEIGKVDLLKAGHHGYAFSSTQSFIKTLNPDITIITNTSTKKIYPNVYWNLTMTAGSAIFVTGELDGIIADFSGANIVLSNNIH